MSTASIRALRADLAAAIRRAGHGERIVVTVGGRPTAQLAPLDDDRAPDLARMIASGAVLPPRRTTPWRPPNPTPVRTGVRLDRTLAEVRR